jgi:deoxyribonuclease V
VAQSGIPPTREIVDASEKDKGAEPGPGRFGAADVSYPAAGGARAALVVASDLRYSAIVSEHVTDLDPQGRHGLGAHLHDEFVVPVIGVAKTAYHTATHAIPVRRGTATRPLYVTAVGVDPGLAVTWVTDMAGVFRLPDALRRVDTLSRSRPPGTHPTRTST